MVRSWHYRQGLTNDFLTFYMHWPVVLGHRFPDTHWSKIGKRVGNLHEILDYCQSWEAPEYIRTKIVSGQIRLHLQVRKLQSPPKMWNATQIKRIALHRISFDFSTFKCLRRRSQCTWEHWTYIWHALQHGVKYIRWNTQNFEKTIFLGGGLDLTHLYCLGVTTAVQIWAVAPLIIPDAVFVFLLQGSWQELVFHFTFVQKVPLGVRSLSLLMMKTSKIDRQRSQLLLAEFPRAQVAVNWGFRVLRIKMFWLN